MNLPMSIQAVIGQQNNNNNNAGTPGGNYPPAPSPGAGGGMPSGSGMPGGMGATPPPRPSPAADGTPPSDQNTPSSRPAINGHTQGVIGISDLTLAPAQKGNQGSLMTSEKHNVKLESGTMLLLKVEPQ